MRQTNRPPVVGVPASAGLIPPEGGIPADLSNRLRKSPSSRGFTLVEMLVVMVIIGVLVAILIPVISRVMAKTKNSTMYVEMRDLARAIETYKTKYNDYPPDFTDDAAVVAHVRIAFPRSNPAETAAWLTTLKTAAATNAPGEGPDPAEALVFWLSMLKNNPRKPLTGTGEFISVFGFVQERLTDLDGDGLLEYVPKHGPGAPYVYFDGRVRAGVHRYRDAFYPFPATSQLFSSLGTVRPYRSNNVIIPARDNNRTQPATLDNPTQWMEPEKFQILSAGLDNLFGGNFSPDPNAPNPPGFPIYRQFPEPNQMDEDENDNLASFADGQTLADSIP